MRYRYVRDMPAGKSILDQFPRGIIPKGTERDTPRGHRLCQMGIAEPVDDECRIACGKSQDQLEAAQEAYPMLEAGIIEEDREAYKAGALTGYNPDGSWIEGPNYDAWMIDHEDEDEDDE